MDMTNAGGPPPGEARGADKSPSYYGILERDWLIGHEPQNVDEWALELRLLTHNMQREFAELQSGAAKGWATGRRPDNDREWELEYTFQQLANQRQSDGQERELRYRVILDAAKQAAQGAAVRSWVLLAIVAAVILMPVVGMLAGIQAQTFSQFIAPVTGIAGTVLGYWFGQNTTGGDIDAFPTPDRSQSSATSIPSFPKPPDLQ